ncbi:MAG: 16S rRNA (uracil(1498)-N(3))-methyltransferase [Propionibacteriaceae bacterium]|nr:16S rRNA (uracil(1498)-N(3))-methyltransferase [Propionibacteriaceae bacterium]
MSDALFLGPLGAADIGDQVELTGDEARHAVAVKRTEPGESILISDGAGRAVRGRVVLAEKQRLVIEVTEVLAQPPRGHRLVVVQALAKGERAERAVEIMTELGADEIIAWQASRSIVRWQGERGEKSLARWAATAREATKQSRRLRVPELGFATTKEVAARIAAADGALILHEEATCWLREAELPARGEVLLVVGPEGGISPEELEVFEAAGGRPTLISDGVLRTSTAGAAALAQLAVLLG